MRATNLVLKNEAHTGICVVYAPSQEMPAIHSHTGYPHFSHSKMTSRLKTGQQQQDTGKDTELLCCYWCCWAVCGVSYRRTSGVLLYYSLPYSFETGPLTEPGTRPVTNPSDPPVCLPQSWGYMWPHLAFHMGAGDLNSGSLCLHSKYSYPPSHLPSSN